MYFEEPREQGCFNAESDKPTATSSFTNDLKKQEADSGHFLSGLS